MAKFINRRRFTIEWGHCDPAGIVFNSRFFEFFDWGTWMLFEAALGVKPSDLSTAFGIVGLPLVDAGARFLAPARFGDVVELIRIHQLDEGFAESLHRSVRRDFIECLGEKRREDEYEAREI